MRNLSIITLLLLTSGFNSLFSQKIASPSGSTKTTFEYYISIAGISSRSDVMKLESLIQKKEGVLFFMADRYPVRCFILKSNRSVNEQEFTGWLKPFSYKVESFGTGNEGKENAYILYNNHKKAKQ